MSQLSRGNILDRLAGGESFRAVNFVRADLSALDLARIDLSEANLRMADLNGADLTEARLTGASLSGASLNDVNLVGSNMIEASLIGALMKGADLSRADLSGADLTGAYLEAARLVGAYMVGTFLNETDLRKANLTGAYLRMAQMVGSNLSNAVIENADLSHADLSGSRLNHCCLAGANLSGANLSASDLSRADLRNADLTEADLRGCNLTGAKLHGVKSERIKLDDAWAEWVDLSLDGKKEDRALLEEVFANIVGRPMAQLMVEGRVSDSVWAVILSHLCAFQAAHPQSSDVRLKAIQHGMNSSAIYLEADSEISLAAYFAEFADIMGNGSSELTGRLAPAVTEQSERGVVPKELLPAPLQRFFDRETTDQPFNLEDPLGLRITSHVEALQNTSFWTSEKAIAILTPDRRIWLETASSDSLTLRPPHGSTVGLDLVRGRFTTQK
ncbi:MAG TPA: pentapeptide repeat-containing protein [Blastocatellia bacterium]|nr:pentapeptide repeat-containing protein [Blastocatellia bacterium]